MIEQKWHEQEGRIGGEGNGPGDTHYYLEPDEPGLWFPHPEKMGWFVKLQYRSNLFKKYPDSDRSEHEQRSYWSDWVDVSTVEEDR